eukprot:1106439-Heterocapsa_arctica.AAC.1
MELHSQLRVPMLKIIGLAIFRWSLLQGLVIPPERGAEWALLRPREIARMARLLVLVPEDGGVVQDRALLTVKDPKNAAFMGRQQIAYVDDPSAVAWLGWLCPPCPRLPDSGSLL